MNTFGIHVRKKSNRVNVYYNVGWSEIPLITCVRLPVMGPKDRIVHQLIHRFWKRKTKIMGSLMWMRDW